MRFGDKVNVSSGMYTGGGAWGASSPRSSRGPGEARAGGAGAAPTLRPHPAAPRTRGALGRGNGRRAGRSSARAGAVRCAGDDCVAEGHRVTALCAAKLPGGLGSRAVTRGLRREAQRGTGAVRGRGRGRGGAAVLWFQVDIVWGKGRQRGRRGSRVFWVFVKRGREVNCWVGFYKTSGGDPSQGPAAWEHTRYAEST